MEWRCGPSTVAKFGGNSRHKKKYTVCKLARRGYLNVNSIFRYSLSTFTSFLPLPLPFSLSLPSPPSLSLSFFLSLFSAASSPEHFAPDRNENSMEKSPALIGCLIQSRRNRIGFDSSAIPPIGTDVAINSVMIFWE